MAVLVVDSGILIAYERRAAHAVGWMTETSQKGTELVVAAPALAEVWRDGARQARLARLLGTCFVLECGADIGRAAGRLLGSAGSTATMDALIVASAAHLGGAVLTDDLDDIVPLAELAGVRVAPLHPV